MGRSALRSGKIDARDRATKRRRDRHAVATSPVNTPSEAFDRWYSTNANFDRAQKLDLDRFLQHTAHIDLECAERLRMLAIREEYKVPWPELDRIYQRALSFNPHDAWIHASRGISASSYAKIKGFDSDPKAATRLLAESEASFLRATSLAPADARIAYAHGHAVYSDASRDTTEALAHFERAIALNRNDEHPWKFLYRAHCLHDLERWSEAAAAYDAVPKDGFAGPTNWRMHLLVEQRAYCLLRAGDIDGAREGFERILTRYESQVHLAQWGDLTLLRRAVEERFPDLRNRVSQLADRLEDYIHRPPASS